MTTRAFLACVAAIVSAAVFAGIMTVGGPFEGRRERFDEQRYGDLTSLAQALRCRDWRSARPVLPAELTMESLIAHCPGPAPGRDSLVDKETGEPYVYIRKNDREFSICAKFHDAENVVRLAYRFRDNPSFDPVTGCITDLVQ
jgi:hypothetical protein